ncbi:DUF6458 family protein [Actinomadura rugatobispora]|uniref:DUF6458 family protein n=1 Tax=Actinomadura rugatobispora TaxID=1994 RepID=A0ABW0ZRC1_9ACTN|nr:hypothetical protein GCM10010200_043470 [Actinomadura rugatobispora]
MGIGVSLAFIAIGAILAFALNVDLSGVNIHLVGFILIAVGLISMWFTLKYTRPRRRANLMAGTDPGYVEAERPAPETVVQEERIIERPADGPVERVERVIERPVPPSGQTGHSQPIKGDPPTGHAAQDPAHAQDPAISQDPARENLTHASQSRRRSPFRR